MKKMFVLLAAVVITAGAWATPSPSPAENPRVKAAFEKEFTGASNVQWSGNDGVYIASFMLRNEKMRAWFNTEGEMEAVQRYVQKEQMTYLSARSVDQLETGQTILSIAEINKNDEMYYLVKSENDKFESLYKLTPAGNLSRIEKKKKK